jgi:DNA helicase II / ATP-dependent DNA helicase PcrA
MIDYKTSLNAAQYAAVTATESAVLVVAGAGSGKTRTIVYRLAYLAEHGVDPHSMLLLTFTRKAAQEMLHRASHLLDQGLAGVQGGTFHSFAFSALRQFPPAWLAGRHATIMDSADINAALKQCKDDLHLGKGDRSFPKTAHIASLLSKARNKEMPLDEVIRRDACHLMPHADALCQIEEAYAAYRRRAGLLDYDDLLFELEGVLRENALAAQSLRERFRFIMVDEYQDTNRVQARLVRLLAGQEGAEGSACSVMAVGDEAQSIYAFRGADVRNILDFPTLFPKARIIRLEENYRSTQPVLDVANALLRNAPEGYRKQLFTSKAGGEPVRYVVPINDNSQADLVTARVQELLQSHLPHEIAVLFRAGFHSYQLELALRKAGIAFRKYGGLKFSDAAHIKDVIAYARMLLNPLDMPAFERIAALHRGIGPKTMRKLYALATEGQPEATHKAFAKFPEFLQDIAFLDDVRAKALQPEAALTAIVEHYRPLLEEHYPEDYPRRQQGLEEITHMAADYQALDLFMADLALESPDEEEQDSEGKITLSTVHSAKGLEWNAVIILDLVEDRFPSRHALARPEEFEEERRLLYVACTRARQILDLCVPAATYNRQERMQEYAVPSPFMRELPSTAYQTWVESFGGMLHQRGAQQAAPSRLLPPRQPQASAPEQGKAVGVPSSPVALGYCRHRIFGRGKAVKYIAPDKMQVHFPGLGIKTILTDYLVMEEGSAPSCPAE